MLHSQLVVIWQLGGVANRPLNSVECPVHGVIDVKDLSIDNSTRLAFREFDNPPLGRWRKAISFRRYCRCERTYRGTNCIGDLLRLLRITLGDCSAGHLGREVADHP